MLIAWCSPCLPSTTVTSLHQHTACASATWLHLNARPTVVTLTARTASTIHMHEQVAHMLHALTYVRCFSYAPEHPNKAHASCIHVYACESFTVDGWHPHGTLGSRVPTAGRHNSNTDRQKQIDPAPPEQFQSVHQLIPQVLLAARVLLQHAVYKQPRISPSWKLSRVSSGCAMHSHVKSRL